jgi:ABC-type Fe3+ transport system permease subunit
MGSALAIVTMLAVGLASLVIVLMLGRWLRGTAHEAVERAAPLRDPLPRLPLRADRALPIFAFNDAEIIAFPLAGFSTRWFEQLWTTQALHDALGNSLFIAAVTAVIATSLGICAAQAGAGRAFRASGGSWVSSCCPLCCPRSSSRWPSSW